MGLSPFAHCGTADPKKCPPNVNPDPQHFEIRNAYIKGKWAALVVRYHNCITFEGDKVLVTNNIYHTENLIRIGRLDPHFDPDSSIFARFIPTKQGWDSATRFVDQMHQESIADSPQ